MKFKELVASGTLNRANYDHYVGLDSRAKTRVVTDQFGGRQVITTHFHGNRVAGQVVVSHPTGKTQYFLRADN